MAAPLASTYDETCPVTCDDSSSGASGVDWGSDSDAEIARQTWATQNMASERPSKPLFQKYRKGIYTFMLVSILNGARVNRVALRFS
jgi:hypothetical protein